MAEITRRRQGELLAGVFEVLQKHPGGLAAKDVLRQVGELVPPTPFEASGYPNRPGVRRHDKIIRFSTVPFVKAGWLVKTKGMWIATDEGLAAFSEPGPDLESWFRAGSDPARDPVPGTAFPPDSPSSAQARAPRRSPASSAPADDGTGAAGTPDR